MKRTPLLAAIGIGLMLGQGRAAVPPSQPSYRVNLGIDLPERVGGSVPFWIDTTDTSVNAFGLPRPVSDQSRLPVSTALSGVGQDGSTTQPAALTLLATMTVANPGQYYVQNQSAGPIQVIYDDGIGTAGTVSTQLIGPGGANAQGGDTSPPLKWFTGRIRVYGASGAQIMARHN